MKFICAHVFLSPTPELSGGAAVRLNELLCERARKGDLPMTVKELIAALQALEQQHGDELVLVLQYNGGDDVPCTVRPEVEYGLVMLKTRTYDA